MHYAFSLSYMPEMNLYLDEWSDFGFALAHLALESAEYAAHYRHKARLGVDVFLDNSFHELREPLPLEKLLYVGEMVEASVICAPDWIDSPEKTVRAAHELYLTLEGRRNTGAVIVGRDAKEMLECWKDLPHGDGIVYCLPYKCDRLGFLKLLQKLPDNASAWHLLGMHDVRELKACAAEFERLTGSPKPSEESGNVCFDSAKPLTYAYCDLPYDPEITTSGKATRPPFKCFSLSYNDQQKTVKNILTLKASLAEVTRSTH